MILTTAILSFVFGVVVTIVVQYLCVKRWFLQLPEVDIAVKPQSTRFQLPKSLGGSIFSRSREKARSEPSKDKDAEVETKGKQEDEEACLSVNLILQFLFRDVKDTTRARRWMFRKLDIEFDELLKTTTGRLLDKIQVHEINFGGEFPVVQCLNVQKVDLKDGAIETLDIGIYLDYGGGFHLAVDVDLLLGTRAYLSVKVTKLQGKARLQLTRQPFTHWSFSFQEEPKMEFEVDSRFNGRPIPQITSLIVNQIKRTLRKKHILPNYKMRFKPFFRKEDPLPDHVTVRGRHLGTGQLEVMVMECSRLRSVIPDAFLHCTISVDSLSQTEIWKRSFAHRTVTITAPTGGNIGLNLVDKNKVLWEHSERPLVVVDNVILGSPACLADIKQGDIVEFIGNARVMSARQAAKQIRSAGDRFTIRIRRPHIRSHYQNSSLRDEFTTSQETEIDISDIESREDSEGFINISLKPDDQYSHQTEENKSRQTSDKPKFIDRAQKGLSILNAGKKKLLGRKESDTTSNIAAQTGRNQHLSPAHSPSTSPELQRKSIPSEADLNVKAARSQSVTVPPKKSKLDDSEVGDRCQSAKSSPQKRLSEIKRPRSHSDTCLNKLSEGDSSSLGGDGDSGTDTTPDDSHHTEDHRTKQVPFSANPHWNETFTFDCKSDSKFVNVCLWCQVPQIKKESSKQTAGPAKKEQDKTERVPRILNKTLVGYVSLPLADVALHCMMTAQGDSLHTLYLNSPEPLAMSSRTKLLKMVQLGYDTTVCHGDITLKFSHDPAQPVDPALRKDLLKAVLEPEAIPPHLQYFEQSTDEQIGGKEGSDKHSFIATQFSSGTHCNYCGKKIWFKAAFQCCVCYAACHKKCVQKCQMDTICTKSGIKDRSRPGEKWVSLAQHGEIDRQQDKEEGGKPSGLFSKFRKDTGQIQLNIGTHTKISPQVSPQPSPIPSPVPSPHTGRRSFSGLSNGSVSDQPTGPGGIHLSVSDMFRSSSSSSISQLFSQLASPAVTPTDTKDDDSDDSDDDREVRYLIQQARRASDRGHGLDDTVVIEAKEKGRELYAHLSLPERKQTLDDMVTKLQNALDKESEHKSELMRAQLGPIDEAAKRQIKIQLDKSDEKMEALMMMMVHYCAGLQHCMDMEEEEDKKVVSKETKTSEDCGIEFIVTQDSPMAEHGDDSMTWD